MAFHETCISCMRCVSICPAHARSISPILTAVAVCKMKKTCSVPKKNELFLGE
ncbi:4Fe-4S binding protein [Evtepia gabavorous]|uniref:4Fe-4S binding protein n=1 Tax=Evtepia gabavorous TaxID=2211183 RepID=UPI003A944CDC